jgi:uncharacterized protein (DUF2147 family)
MRLRLPRHGCTPLLLLLLALPLRASAADTATAAPDSPVGRWKTIDDHTGQAKAIVEIREDNGELDGRIVELFHPPSPHPLCIKCTGALKDKPVMGMQILWGMRRDGSDWTGGHILDPETGNIYRCTIAIENGGKALRLRGYIGLSIFGRTEKWVRLEAGE